MLYSPQRVVRETNKAIAGILSGELRLLRKIQAFVIESGGKRIRPLFLYYLAHACGVAPKELIELGALLEILHAASLLHDDVVDGAEERRARPTAAKIFGNKEVVLAGDHLLATGLRRLNQLGNPQYLEIFTHAVIELTTAELLQLQLRFDLKTREKDYARIIDGKTASLFCAAGALVAVMRGERDFYRSETAGLGLLLGRFFQLRDDHLDYFDPVRLKKQGLQDFTNGTVTAPLLLLLQSASRSELREIRAAWQATARTGKAAGTSHILSLMEKYGIREKSENQLEHMQQELLARIAKLPEERPRQVILQEFQKILAMGTKKSALSNTT